MASHLDFRYLDEGLGGERGKHKRREVADAAAADSMDLDADAPRPSKVRTMPSLSDPSNSKPASFGQPTYDGVIASEEADAVAADSMNLNADAPRLSKVRTMPSLSDPSNSKPASFGQPTYDGFIAGRVSGLGVGGV